MRLSRHLLHLAHISRLRRMACPLPFDVAAVRETHSAGGLRLRPLVCARPVCLPPSWVAEAEEVQFNRRLRGGNALAKKLEAIAQIRPCTSPSLL